MYCFLLLEKQKRMHVHLNSEGDAAGTLTEVSLLLLLLNSEGVSERWWASMCFGLYLWFQLKRYVTCATAGLSDSHLFAHLLTDLFVFVTVRHGGAKRAWSHMT